jgi:predicted phosphodiesterase
MNASKRSRNQRWLAYASKTSAFASISARYGFPAVSSMNARRSAASERVTVLLPAPDGPAITTSRLDEVVDTTTRRRGCASLHRPSGTSMCQATTDELGARLGARRDGPPRVLPTRRPSRGPPPLSSSEGRRPTSHAPGRVGGVRACSPAPMRLLHVSDIHAKPGDPFDQYLAEIPRAAGVEDIDFIIASGDLGLKGQDADLAATFLLDLADTIGLSANAIVCCPGNHDLDARAVPNLRFAGYLRAMQRLHGDPAPYDPTAGGVASVVRDVGFVAINSAYHGDYRYGKVELNVVERCLDRVTACPVKLVLVHHHMLPLDGDDSHVRNTYELLTLLDARGVDAVLHGHQHMRMRMLVGRKTRIIGAGTLNFQPHHDVGRQFNVIDVGMGWTRYRYQADAVGPGGRLGHWLPFEKEVW